MKNNRESFVDWILAGFALISLFLALCPYEIYKNVGDRFAADGNLERLSPELVLILRLCFGILFIIFFGIVFWGKRDKNSRDHFFHSLISLPGRCIHDVKPFFRDLNSVFYMKRTEAYALILIIIAGIALRAIQLNIPLKYDEAYTIIAWGRSDLHWAISDYHLPNNHVFHTILVNLIFHNIGKSVWMLRLPVFISGCLLIVAVYLLGKTLYNNSVALLAAGFTAFAPYLVYYSVDARGYELQALFTVVTVGLAIYARRKNNIFSWLLLIFFSGLNFYTLPTSLYPFGGICVWLFLNVIFFSKERERERSGVEECTYSNI